ncbi:unnamed protein product [Withania somnifera]
MGKYIRKSKAKGEVSPLGVLTRAKALAQKKLNIGGAAAAETEAEATGNGCDGGSYLELRSGKLVKPFTVLEGKGKKNGVLKNQQNGGVIRNPNKIPNVKKKKKKNKSADENLGDLKVDVLENLEASFGENFLDCEGRNRTTRENTPCSLIRDSDSIPTPGSSTRRSYANEANRRVPNSMRAEIPTASEMEEFFAHAEEQQHRKFIEKYNFDIVNDKPLSGRYEWVKVDH